MSCKFATLAPDWGDPLIVLQVIPTVDVNNHHLEANQQPIRLDEFEAHCTNMRADWEQVLSTAQISSQ